MINASKKPDNQSSSKINAVLSAHRGYISSDKEDFDKIKPEILHSNLNVYIMPNTNISDHVSYIVWINGKMYVIEDYTTDISGKWSVVLPSAGTEKTGIDTTSKTGYCLYDHTFSSSNKYLIWALADSNSEFQGFAFSILPQSSYTGVSSGSMGALGTYTGLTDAYQFRTGATVLVTAGTSEKNYGVITSIDSNTQVKIKMYPSSNYWGDTNTNITSTTSPQITQMDKYYPWNGNNSSSTILERLFSPNYRLLGVRKSNIMTHTVGTELPVGTIIAWHKDWTTANVLPDGWEECDGSNVSDRRSIVYGKAKPNLNGDGRFLRGGTTSGTLQNASQFYHFLNNTSGARMEIAANVTDMENIVIAASTTIPTATASQSQTQRTYRIRPINMSVVYIIKVW